MSGSDPIPRLNAALSGRYRIERELGAGGMATVYLADDLRHERKVALKVLKPELAAVVGAERFLAEIKTTANLQHPHILPLFDSGEVDSFLYFVMPYVEGESLRDRLDREVQLPVEDAVRIATEVADALAHAHAKGVIHRDIKPANILLRDGRVQVADFGIALAVQQAGGERLTETGLSVGTPYYMSPEQAAGDRELDGRSDIFSLGGVLYEMLAGEPPYTGTTAQSILARILTEEPKPLSQLRRSAPPHVEMAVKAALEKLPADRVQSAQELIGLLEGGVALATDRSRMRPLSSRFVQGGHRGVGAGLLVLALVVGGASGYLARSALGPGEAVPAPVFKRITFDETAVHPRLSPDGTQLAYAVTECPPDGVCRDQLMVRDVAGGDPVSLGPTVLTDEGEVGPTYFSSIEWSPDGQRILFSALYGEQPARTGVYSIPRLGGTPTMLAEGRIPSAAFRSGVDVVDWLEGSGNRDFPTALHSRAPDGSVESHPLPVYATKLAWSPDGQWLALFGHQEFGPVLGGPMLFIVGSDWQVVDRVRIDRWAGEGQPHVRWDATGDAVYTLLGGDLLKVGVERASGSFRGPPQIVSAGIEPPGMGARAQFDVARDGRSLVYVKTTQRIEVRALQITPTGEAHRTLAAGTTIRAQPALSPDGETVAYLREDQLGSNVYLQRISGGREWALTATAGYKIHPRWSSDGDQLAYVGFEEDGAWLFTVPTEGGQTRRRVRVSSGRFPAFAWFPDGKRVLYQAETGMLSVLSMSPEGDSSEPLFEAPDQGHVWGFLVSPDGESMVAFNFGLDRQGIVPVWADVASLEPGAPAWKNVFRGDWRTFDRTPYETTGALPEWRWQTPHAWEEGRLIISQDHRQGNRVFGGLWALPIGGGEPDRLVDLGELCGAPSYVGRDAAGRHLVCIHREMDSDIWEIENFDPAHLRP